MTVHLIDGGCPPAFHYVEVRRWELQLHSEHTRIRQVTSGTTTLYITDPATGVSLEKATGSGGSVQTA